MSNKLPIDPANYVNLAWSHVNASNKKGIRGVEVDDLFQSAMLGIVEASKKYNESIGKFETYAFWYIQRAINKSIYRLTTTTGNKKVHVPKITEVLYDDLPSSPEAMDKDDRLSTGDDKEFYVWCEEYLDLLNLPEDKLEFFMNLAILGDKEATSRYKEKTGVTRQRTNQVKQEIREYAQKVYLRHSGED